MRSRLFYLLLTGLLAAVLLLLTFWTAIGRAQPPAPVLINAVLYDGYESGDKDEAVQIVNISPSSVTLDGWQLNDGGSARVTLPAGVSLAPGAAIWLTWEATAFRRQFGHQPDWEAGDTDPTVPDLIGSWPGFANSGDEVLLYDNTGGLVDALVYGGSSAQTGWSGDALQPYTVSSVFGASGQILFRRLDSMTGRPIADSDRAGDWAQDAADPVAGRRVRYPGWDLDDFFRPVQITQTAPLTIAIAPDNAYETVAAAIDQAQTSLAVASLTFESIAIGDALIAAAARGVTVTVLLEGGPIGGVPDQEKYICQALDAAGGRCWFMISDASQRIYDRYRYYHAKFIIVDGQRALISSENLSPNSLPDDDKSDGTWGRRGVVFLTEAPGVVAQLEAIFAADLDPVNHVDLRPWSSLDPVYGPPPADFVPITITGGTTYTVRYPTALVAGDVSAFSVIQAPEHALQAETGLLALLAAASAGDTVLVQQLSEQPYWGPTNSSPAQDPNVRLEALLAAARRGAVVRLLLDAYFDDPTNPRANSATCYYVNTIAAVEALDLACRTGNPAGLGIHNKMVLAEIAGQGYALVGSWNGSELSTKGNRELALLVTSNATYALLAAMFNADWPALIFLPVVPNQFVPPARHLLISEVLYDPAGADDKEFVEIYNPTALAVDISGFSLSDAVDPADYEDLRRFPAGTIIAPGATLVVATSATAFNAEFGFPPDFEIVTSDPTVPDLIDDPNWGSPETFLQLGNSGDEVLLRDVVDQIIDGLSYGSGQLPGQTACSLVAGSQHVLERFPPDRDSDDCPRDFRDWPFPNPGQLPQ